MTPMAQHIEETIDQLQATKVKDYDQAEIVLTRAEAWDDLHIAPTPTEEEQIRQWIDSDTQMLLEFCDDREMDAAEVENYLSNDLDAYWDDFIPDTLTDELYNAQSVQTPETSETSDTPDRQEPPGAPDNRSADDIRESIRHIVQTTYYQTQARYRIDLEAAAEKWWAMEMATQSVLNGDLDLQELILDLRHRAKHSADDLSPSNLETLFPAKDYPEYHL